MYRSDREEELFCVTETVIMCTYIMEGIRKDCEEIGLNWFCFLF